MQANHTPGPWVHETRRGRAIIIDADRNEVCEAFAAPALIAAAPELLAMLVKLTRAIERLPAASPLDGLAEDARTVIARATGEA